MEVGFIEFNTVIHTFPAITAMAFVPGTTVVGVVGEPVSESQSAKNNDIATLGLMVGFTVMMTLDVAFGCCGFHKGARLINDKQNYL